MKNFFNNSLNTFSTTYYANYTIILSNLEFLRTSLLQKREQKEREGKSLQLSLQWKMSLQKRAERTEKFYKFYFKKIAETQKNHKLI